MKNNQKIPEGWSVKKLKACLSLLKDGTHGTHVDVSNGVMLLSAKDVVNGQIILSENTRKISFNDFNTLHKNYHIQNDDIVLTIVGTIGRCAIVKNYDNNYTFQRSVAILRPNKEISSKYLFSYIQGNSFQKELLKRQSVSAQPGVYLDDLSKISLIFPPLPEQEKIAGILGTWDKAIEKLSSLIEQKKNLKKSLMQRLLTGKTRLKGFTQPWKEVKLGEIADFISGYSFDSEDFKEEGIALIRISNIGNDQIIIDDNTVFLDNSFIEKYQNYCIKPQDLLVAMSGATTGKMGVNKFNFPLLLNQRVGIIRAKNNNQCFINQYLIRFNNKILRMSYGGAQPNISSYDIKKIKLYIPSDTNEQKAIADVLSIADEEIDLLNKKLEALKEQKKGLMQQLLTGQTRVKVN